MGESFGPKGKLNNVFDLVGEFEPGQKNVIFSVSLILALIYRFIAPHNIYLQSDAVNIVPEAPTNIDKNSYNNLHCL